MSTNSLTDFLSGKSSFSDAITDSRGGPGQPLNSPVMDKSQRLLDYGKNREWTRYNTLAFTLAELASPEMAFLLPGTNARSGIVPSILSLGFKPYMFGYGFTPVPTSYSGATSGYPSGGYTMFAGNAEAPVQLNYSGTYPYTSSRALPMSADFTAYKKLLEMSRAAAFAPSPKADRLAGLFLPLGSRYFQQGSQSSGDYPNFMTQGDSIWVDPKMIASQGPNLITSGMAYNNQTTNGLFSAYATASTGPFASGYPYGPGGAVTFMTRYFQNFETVPGRLSHIVYAMEFVRQIAGSPGVVLTGLPRQSIPGSERTTASAGSLIDSNSPRPYGYAGGWGSVSLVLTFRYDGVTYPLLDFLVQGDFANAVEAATIAVPAGLAVGNVFQPGFSLSPRQLTPIKPPAGIQSTVNFGLAMCVAGAAMDRTWLISPFNPSGYVVNGLLG